MIAFLALAESPTMPLQPGDPGQNPPAKFSGEAAEPIEKVAPAMAYGTPKAPRPSSLYVVVDHAGLPLSGVSVGSYASRDEERAFALDPRTVIGITDEDGELSVTKAERSAVDARHFAYRKDIGSVPFTRNGNDWLAQYPQLGSLTIHCKGLDGSSLSGVPVVITRRAPIARRFLMAADSERPLISPTEDLDKRIYKGVSGPNGVIRIAASAGHYVAIFTSPYMAFHSGFDPYQGVSIPGPVYEAVFSPMYAVIANWPSSEVLTATATTPTELSGPNAYSADSLTHARALLMKKFPSALLQVFAPAASLDRQDLQYEVKAYWKNAGWHTHTLDIVKLSPDIEAQKLTPPPPVHRDIVPQSAELLVTLLDKLGNAIPMVSNQARFVDDFNLSEKQRGPPELGSPPLRSFQSGTPKQLRPGNYSLSSRSDVLSRALAGARVSLDAGERKELKFEANEITRPCQIVSEGTEDAGFMWIGLQNAQGEKIASYGFQGKRHRVVRLPLGPIKLTIHRMEKLIFEQTLNVTYDPLYSVQEIEIPREVFTR